jgi:hypothetical protein
MEKAAHNDAEGVDREPSRQTPSLLTAGLKEG